VCPVVNCFTCNGGGQCQLCADGFAMNGGVGVCSPCHPTCLTCSTPNNDGTCSTCPNNTYLNSANHCVICSSAWGLGC
jgi:hypothetical protein